MSGEKYHYENIIDKETVNRGETSHAKLLQWVKPKTRVLECGCAYGIMTRYMKEVLGCHVVVLELEQEAFQEAMIYADEGYCVNLEDDCWLDKIPENSFDYIMYADVLEHLRDPETVLKKMRRFLKPDGNVLLSVPNIAYGDIIMNLLCDQFTYTPLGLLDNTHIHLFARKNLHDMVKMAGYYMAEEDCTTVPLFASEQGQFLPEEKKSILEEALITHTTRNIYQYVCRITIKKVELFSKIQYNLTDDAVSKIYYDDGTGFCAEHCINIKAEQENDCYIYRTKLPTNCTQIRYDPVEAKKCFISKLECFCGGIEAPVLATNGIGFDGNYFFVNEDPQIIISLDSYTSKEIVIKTKLNVLSNESWRYVEKFLIEQSTYSFSTINYKEQQLQALNHAKEEMERVLTDTRSALDIKEQQLQAVNHAKEEVEQQLQAVNHAKDEVEQAYQISESVRSSIEREKMRLYRELRNTEVEKQSLNQKVFDSDQIIQRLSSDIVGIQNSLSWRITKPIRVIKSIFLSFSKKVGKK